jgi:hypothetical protein
MLGPTPNVQVPGLLNAPDAVIGALEEWAGHLLTGAGAEATGPNLRRSENPAGTPAREPAD